MELGALVAKALLAGAESLEVLSGLGDDVVEELEVDAARSLCGRWSAPVQWRSVVEMDCVGRTYS